MRDDYCCLGGGLRRKTRSSAIKDGDVVPIRMLRTGGRIASSDHANDDKGLENMRKSEYVMEKDVQSFISWLEEHSEDGTFRGGAGN
jgi:hypothetical protein